MFQQVAKVLEITVPIFALIGLGRYFHQKKWLNDDVCSSVNYLIAHYSLPAIIFVAVARTSFNTLINPPVIVASVVPVFLGLALSTVCCRLFQVKGEGRAVFGYSPYWANLSYVGIPLATFAFADVGEVNSAIVNAFGMPLVATLGTATLAFYSESGDDSLFQRAKGAVLNPIVLSAFLGVLFSLIVDSLGLRDICDKSFSVRTLINIISGTLLLLGKMGLPMALLVIGASLRFDSKAHQKRILVFGCVAKLILTPLASLLILKLFFPNTPKEVVGACVLVMGTPTAVASYVMSTKLKVAEDLSSALIVWTTMGSIITIPIWTYILLS